MVRDGAARLLTMRRWILSAETDLILRSPPKAGVSKDGRGKLLAASDSRFARKDSG
jgi:hypothetical protein